MLGHPLMMTRAQSWMSRVRHGTVVVAGGDTGTVDDGGVTGAIVVDVGGAEVGVAVVEGSDVDDVVEGTVVALAVVEGAVGVVVVGLGESPSKSAAISGSSSL